MTWFSHVDAAVDTDPAPGLPLSPIPEASIRDASSMWDPWN